MTFPETLALLGALIAPEPDTTRFDPMLSGGYPGEAPVAITPCRRPLGTQEIERETVICGTVTVPEDHDAPDNGNTVDLSFAILRAKTGYPAEDPLVYLHGGPGYGNLASGLAGAAGVFGKFRQTRDVVTFDQRAAGISSGSVACRQAMTDNIADVARGRSDFVKQDEGERFVVSEFFENCLAELEARGVDISKYNTRQNALDTPMVLKALGYETWNLYGISYGTKLAMEVMRLVPEGTRAVVLDGVAPPVVKLYDTLTVPLAESMQRLADDCAAEPACDAAYPELDRVMRELLASAAAGDLVIDGDVVPPELPLVYFMERAEPAARGSLTPYLPAMLYEMHRGGAMPTLEMVVEEWDLHPPLPDADSLLAEAEGTLSEGQVKMLSLALKDGRIAADAEEALGIAVSELREQLRRDREMGPLPSLFDAELSAAVPDTITTPEAAAAALTDYAALGIGTPTRARLTEFVAANFDGPHLRRLLAIVEAMTEAEVAQVYAYAGLEVSTRELGFQKDANLRIYACQEDMPYNTLQGFRATTEAQPFDLSSIYGTPAEAIYASCDAFTPVERENWHEVVESDIPTVSIGSGWDVQTAASWAERATEGLSDARSFFIAEAGHGALLYQPCVRDLTAAFIADPGRELDDSCERETAVPPFHIAPWVDEDAAD